MATLKIGRPGSSPSANLSLRVQAGAQDVTEVVNAANQAPVASGGTLSITESTSQTVDFSALGSDPDGDPISLDAAPTAGTGTISNVNLAAGTATYTAPAGAGSDTINFVLTDGELTDAGAVSVTINAASAGTLAVRAVNRSGGIAPVAIFFEVTTDAGTLGVSNRDHDPLYKWTFGEAANGTQKNWDYVTRAASIWSTSNDVAYGPKVMHVFAEPGTYTVTCECWTTRQAGANFSGSVQVTIDDPDVAYAGKTAVVAIDNNFSGAPAGDRYTSISAAMNAIGPDGRIRLKGGETYGGFGGIAGTRLLVDSWGAGRPTVTDGVAVINGYSDQVAFRGFDILGSSDATTEATTSTTVNFIVSGPSASHITLYDLSADKIWELVEPRKDELYGVEWTLAVANCRVIEWQNYISISAEPHWWGWEGCSFLNNPDNRGGGGGKPDIGPPLNRHGVFRVARPSGTGIATVQCVEGFTNFGWTVTSSTWAPVNRPAHQPFMRWGTAPDLSNEDAYLNMERICHEGGQEIFSIRGYENIHLDLRQNVIVDKAILVASANTLKTITIQHGGTTIRNLLLLHTDGIKELSPQHMFIDIDGSATSQNQTTNNHNAWAHIYGVTVANFHTQTGGRNENASGVEKTIGPYNSAALNGQPDTFADVNLDNWHIYAPNQDTPEVESPAPTLEGPIFTPSYKGLYWSEELLDENSTPHPRSDFANTNHIYLPIPQPGSASYQSATGRIPIDDIRGVIRTGTPSKGCVEP